MKLHLILFGPVVLQCVENSCGFRVTGCRIHFQSFHQRQGGHLHGEANAGAPAIHFGMCQDHCTGGKHKTHDQAYTR